MAEREIKTKIVLEGEQQFRQAMNNASASVKALNAEEKAAEAQFKATGDAEAYREEKTRILTEKLEEQKKAVEAAKKAVEQLTKQGVEKNDKALQQWRTKLANAQTAVAQTEAKLQGFNYTLDGTVKVTDEAAAAANGMAEEIKKIGKTVSVEGAIKSIDRIGDTAIGVTKTVAGLGKKIWDLEADAASWADELITNAQKAGIDVVTYQAWEYAAQMVDTSIDDILSAQTRMNQKLLKESPEVAAAIGNIGVSISDNAGNQRASEDIFWDTIRALNAMDDITERNNKAQQIFGNNYRNLLPLINKGADAWEEYAKEGADNYALNEEQVGKLGDLDDALVKLGASLDKTKMTVLAELAPTFSELAGAMAEAVGAFNDFLATEEGQQMIRDLGEAIGELAMSFLDPGPDGFKSAVNTAKTLLNGVTDALKWLKENKGNVKTALGVIAGGFVVFETAKGLLNIIEAGKSLRNIFASKNKLTGGSGSGADTGLPGLNSGNGGGTGAGIGTQTVTTQTVTTQTVTTQTVTTENVTSENVTSENVTTQNVTSQAVTTDNTTTSNVGTMYVQTMVGGNGTPTNQSNPATPPVTSPSTPSGGGLPSGSSYSGLPSGSGLPLNGAIPLLNPEGGSGLNLPSGADVNISSGNPTVNISGGNPTLNLPSGNPTLNLPSGNPTLNLPSGNSTPNLSSGGGTPAGEPIKLDPSEFNVSGPGQSGQPQLRWPEETPNKKVNPKPDGPDGGGSFGWATAAFAAWGAVLYGAVTGLDHLLGDAERAKDIEARESNLEKAEEAAAALGPEFQEDVDTLTRLVNALGPAVDEQTGEYKLNPFFSTYWEPTDDLGAILGDLGDWRKRGLLYADIQKYGARDSRGDLNVGNGWSPWALLQRYWGEYTGPAYYGSAPGFEWRTGEYAGEKHVNDPLSPDEVNALLEYLQDMYMRKLESLMEGGSVPAEAGAEVGEQFTQGVEGTAGEDAGKGAGSAFITGVIRGMDANSSALAAAADRMGRVMRQGVISGASGGVAAGLLGSLGGAVRSGVSGAGLSARIYMDKQVVGAMVADTVNEVMGSRINNSRR